MRANPKVKNINHCKIAPGPEKKAKSIIIKARAPDKKKSILGTVTLQSPRIFTCLKTVNELAVLTSVAPSHAPANVKDIKVPAASSNPINIICCGRITSPSVIPCQDVGPEAPHDEIDNDIHAVHVGSW